MSVPKGIRIGGRKKGTKNKSTIERETGHAELVAAAKAAGIEPLEYMLRVMRDDKADLKRRDAMAMAAAPFVHPKLAAVTHSGDQEKPIALTGITVEFVKATPADTRRLSPLDDETGGSAL